VGFLSITDNDALRDVAGLSGLTRINASLDIADNGALVDVDDLSNLSSLRWDIDVRNSTALLSLEGLSGLSSIEGDITITDNSRLPQCEACDVLYQFLGYSGTFSSSGNAPDTCSDDCSELPSMRGGRPRSARTAVPPNLAATASSRRHHGRPLAHLHLRAKPTGAERRKGPTRGSRGVSGASPRTARLTYRLPSPGWDESLTGTGIGRAALLLFLPLLLSARVDDVHHLHDLWAETWTAADLNADDFGVALSVFYTKSVGNWNHRES
jgi:hypothetical protein